MYMEHMSIIKFNDWAIQHILDENRFDENGFIIMENETTFKSTGIISKIFEDHWHSYYSKYKSSIDSLRPNANKEVHKIINCSNKNIGSYVYVFPNDDD